MCGRFRFHHPAKEIEAAFGLELPAPLEPRYNIAPTQAVPVLFREPVKGGKIAWTVMRWGLVPAWSREGPGHGPPLHNARAETAASKPMFRNALKRHRCVVPASGFYEWSLPKGAPKKAPKQPWSVSASTGEPLAFAAIWDEWNSPDGSPLWSCSILTLDANDEMARIHHRMPLMFEGGRDERIEAWLDPSGDGDQLVREMLKHPAPKLKLEPISTLVNNARFDGPEILSPPSTSADKAALPKRPKKKAAEAEPTLFDDQA